MSYDFILLMHSIAVIIGCVLGKILIIFYFVIVYQIVNKIGVLDLQFDIEQVKGFWIIFTPFLPGVVWSAWMRRQARLRGMSYSILDEKEKND